MCVYLLADPEQVSSVADLMLLGAANVGKGAVDRVRSSLRKVFKSPESFPLPKPKPQPKQPSTLSLTCCLLIVGVCCSRRRHADSGHQRAAGEEADHGRGVP